MNGLVHMYQTIHRAFPAFSIASMAYIVEEIESMIAINIIDIIITMVTKINKVVANNLSLLFNFHIRIYYREIEVLVVH